MADAAGEHVVALSMLESLPPDVMAKVLEFVNISARVMVARCSKPLQTLVYEDCSVLWMNIHFRNEEKVHVSRLTDDMLAGILTRVKARSVTNVLNLTFCESITGSGLAPLRHSKVLKEAILDRECGNIEDESVAVDIFRTMIPFQLSRVVFSKTIPTLARVETDFLHDLHVAKQKRVKEKHILCTSCSEPIVDESRQLVTNATGPPLTCCTSCNKHYCRRGSCPVEVTDCMKCLDAFCEDCVETTQCSLCKHSYCFECNVSRGCDTCGKFYCTDCQIVPFCQDCYWHLCPDCFQDDRFLYRCQDCQMVLCNVCYDMKRCGCGRILCGDCANECPKCERGFCNSCSERKLNWLECCDDLRCTGCVTPKSCDGCDGMFCRVEVNTCGDCSKSFCDSCREMDRCNYCSGIFCTEGCDGKATGHSDLTCGKVTCKKCRKENGDVGSGCGERPSKKAKQN